jgi:hypothetical protein
VALAIVDLAAGETKASGTCLRVACSRRVAMTKSHCSTSTGTTRARRGHGFGDESEAIWYVGDYGSAWKNTPNAIARAASR